MSEGHRVTAAAARDPGVGASAGPVADAHPAPADPATVPPPAAPAPGAPAPAQPASAQPTPAQPASAQPSPPRSTAQGPGQAHKPRHSQSSSRTAAPPPGP